MGLHLWAHALERVCVCVCRSCGLQPQSSNALERPFSSLRRGRVWRSLVAQRRAEDSRGRVALGAGTAMDETRASCRLCPGCDFLVAGVASGASDPFLPVGCAFCVAGSRCQVPREDPGRPDISAEGCGGLRSRFPIKTHPPRARGRGSCERRRVHNAAPSPCGGRSARSSRSHVPKRKEQTYTFGGRRGRALAFLCSKSVTFGAGLRVTPQ